MSDEDFCKSLSDFLSNPVKHHQDHDHPNEQPSSDQNPQRILNNPEVSQQLKNLVRKIDRLFSLLESDSSKQFQELSSEQLSPLPSCGYPSSIHIGKLSININLKEKEVV